MKYFNLNIDERGIATLTFDTPDSSLNVLCFDALYELEQHLVRMQDDRSIKALFVESAKEDIFIAGADIKEIKAFKDPGETAEKLRQGQEIFNRLENLPFPTVAMIDGACLGGGLELALACAYRVATNAAHTRIGLVEVGLGIIPGLGGTQRLPELVGFAKAIELITASKRLKGDKALKLGLVDASVPSGYLGFKKEEFIRDILAGKLEAKVALTRQGIKWYETITPVKILIASMAKSEVLKKTQGHYPAPIETINVMEKTLTMPLQEGLKVELEAFEPLATGQISKNLIELFFTSEALKKESFSKAKPRSIESAAVMGVGTMGSGIAWALASHNIPVRLGARKMQSIAEALSKMRANFESIKKRGRLTEREIGLKMDRVTYTTTMEGFAKVDIIIEAVSEDAGVKKGIYRALEQRVSEECIIATNTSSLAISGLVEETEHPGRFVGMHFFNPVAKMPLVEVIAGKKTKPKTIATVVALAKKLGKTPIKVKESAGFLVNRILLPYLNESAKMFEEGESVARIDSVLSDFGMPMGPFTLADEVGIDIGEKVSAILYDAYGERMQPSGILAKMTEMKWLGKKTGTGFYVHKGKRHSVNDEIKRLQSQSITLEDHVILDRAILIMVNEAARCLEENVVSTARYLDMAMVLGTGFPAFRGGLLRYADAEGIEEIVERLHVLSQTFGSRFEPAALLVKMAQKQQTFYSEAG
ncbi:fatty-acid oxidation protein subunit alpha [Sulfurovum lithotrophicum]|uniref:enoyl-CoA hydratase n=1 Tax=Sulfurovum lithotrophicum TaxID=206403 RepID=A0A7U4RQR8_9BACT|nr:3-hydroxyacyl-CoA dehydrogenase NAD-binding domain-containing protein [Sulfurovum lithotrophicum]AKF25031.1 fatty-acid oxidation protein subunit alpha [Sulfurovum lithotrophicum]